MRVSINYRGVDLEVEGVYTPEVRGRTSGPPEDCCEDEPSSFEIEDVFVAGTSIIELLEGLVIATYLVPAFVDVLDNLADRGCEICDNMKPDHDEA